MAYVAVKGGQKAIDESIKRLKYNRVKENNTLNVKKVESGLKRLIDQVMSESSLYSEDLASIAIKQAEGSPEEAVFLMRAFRSTLPRKHYSTVINSNQMRVMRRISSSFKDIPGGQVLGATHDFTHRLIDFDLVDESNDDIKEFLAKYTDIDNQEIDNIESAEIPKVVDYLKKEGLMIEYNEDNSPPKDITKESLSFPTKRSERLQILTRGQTGAVSALGYASLRGFGSVHPTVGELRVGYLPVHINDPSNNNDIEDDQYYIGEIKVTEVETITSVSLPKGKGNMELKLDIGYGLCFGQNETKTIAMSILDKCLDSPEEHFPTHDEEFVLYHIDSVEMTGFISHLKLPHYVTFQSKLDNLRNTKEEKK
ncbi:MAG: carbon-phosphorus lyase complex subunit PhnI [Clostridia bacterium]